MLHGQSLLTSQAKHNAMMSEPTLGFFYAKNRKGWKASKTQNVKQAASQDTQLRDRVF